VLGRWDAWWQHNTWETDGHAFYAQHRILRWLGEPLVEAEFSREERRAVERLCGALPELIPPHPPSLTHGDLWLENILADGCGAPALIDPAVCNTWPGVDLAALWCSPRPPASEGFFAVYHVPRTRPPARRLAGPGAAATHLGPVQHRRARPRHLGRRAR
jgi:fructosamine-3-kinase